MNEPTFLTVAEVAMRLRVSPPTVYRLIRDGQLACLRVRRSLRVEEDALADYLRGARGHIEANGEPPTLRERILRALRGAASPLPAADLASRAGVAPNSYFRGLLGEMVREGVVAHGALGYSLPVRQGEARGG